MLKQRVPLLSVLLVLGLLGGFAYASRNAGGTYSLPAGNPVVSGTTITSTWANSTLNDIKTEITNSLDRQGRGGMLAPLQLVAGTSAAPGLTFSLEPGSGWYRAAAGDIRGTVLGTPVLKLQSGLVSSLVPLTVTGRTTTTDLTVTGTSDQLVVTALAPNTHAVVATARANGTGLIGIGGTTSGVGAYAEGGAPNGRGLEAIGAGTATGVYVQGGGAGGHGLEAAAVAGNGTGVVGRGFGTGSGGVFYNDAAAGAGTGALNGISLNANGIGVWGTGTGSYPGVKAVGGATGAGLEASCGVAATAAVRQDNIQSTNGDISLAGVANPNSDVALTNRITPKNITKAWAAITIGAASAVTLDDGLNISSATPPVASNTASCGNNTVDVTFASAFSSGTSFAVIVGRRSSVCEPYVSAQTATTVSIRFSANPTAAVGGTSECNVGCGVNTSNWNGAKFTLIAVGAQ